MGLQFTSEGLGRAMCVRPGPFFIETAVLELADGREVEVAREPSLPAVAGTAEVSLAGPPGGGHVRRVRLLAGDGVCIVSGAINRVLVDGDRLHFPITLT